MHPRPSIRIHIVMSLMILAVSVSGLLAGLSIFQNGQNEWNEWIPTAYAQANSEDVENRRAQLRAELENIQQEIESQRDILQVKQREAASLERDIAILDAQIRKARLSIRARNIAIDRLEAEIAAKSNTIDDLSAKMKRERESLAELLRKANELDDFSLVEIALTNKDLSEFLSDLDAFDKLKEALKRSFEDLRSTKRTTQTEKEELEAKRQEEVELRQIQQLEKQQLERREREKQELLDATRGEEQRYQQIIQQKQKTAAEIRSELFALRGSDSIPFERALELANRVSEETGVRPAFILGVIAEESNLGENVGTGTWQEDMHPTRDRPVFEKITASLGLDPSAMPVSAKPWYGWGGAMGPAQFIPSTWALYAGYPESSNYTYTPSKDRIGKLTGNQPPNPWNPEDAFMAAAILLKDNGATQGSVSCTLTSNPEKCAALRYFAGWTNANDPTYEFYGDQVMELTQKYQNQIEVLLQAS